MSLIDCSVFKQQKTMSHSILNRIGHHLWMAMALKKIDKIIRTFSSHFECTPLYLHLQYSSVPLSEMRSKCIENKIYKKCVTQSVNCLIQNVPMFTSEVSKTHRDILIVSKVNRCVVLSEVFP